MYDQLAGGFARYRVDARWVVPHFEKMLYDNALLLRVYAAPRAGRPARRSPARVARETAEFLLRDLRTAAGRVRLGAGRGHRRRRGPDLRLDARAARRGARRRGRRVGGAAARGHRRRARSSTARRRCSCPADPDEPARWRAGAGRAARRAGPAPAARPGRQGRHGVERAGDRRARRGRRRCSAAGVGRGRRRGARSCCWTLHVVDGRLRRTSRDGVVGAAAGVLEDYADLAEGLLALHQATGAAALAGAARDELLDVALAHFADGDGRLLRHRRRRRGAAAPAPGDHRQRDAVRGGRRWPGRC